MKKDLEEECSAKRSAEYRVRRLEEEVEAGKELLQQAEKEREDSKEEYEHVMEGMMNKTNEAKDEANAKEKEIIELQSQVRKAPPSLY